ncbi:MAG: 3-dehydroquinate synthase [Prevotella sp.]|nr:3-dehydroquinate synthase [Candidatus Equicola stercoris]
MKLINTINLQKTIAEIISKKSYDRIFTLSDTTTSKLCLPLLKLDYTEDIVINEGDDNKTFDALQHIWQTLTDRGATRHSLIINVGGGMVSDIGGFAAATFKRGIDYINIPTTLLAMVDASIGGKTGINFNGLKNEIGVFRMPEYIVIHTPFLSTLATEAILSGMAEMLKHSLLSNKKDWATIINSEITKETIQTLPIFENIQIKNDFIEKDPFENDIRKVLNLGHTFGHAIESWSFGEGRKSIPHGYAVAYGLICSLYISTLRKGFPQDTLRQTVRFINENYGKTSIGCNDYDEIIRLMHHDKKNNGSIINMIMLSDFGKYHLDQPITDDEIKETLDFLREG